MFVHADGISTTLADSVQVVGVAIDSQAAVRLLHRLVAHPAHHFVETAPALLTASSFDTLVPKIIGYRQVSDATLLHLADVCDLRLTTFDRPCGSRLSVG